MHVYIPSQEQCLSAGRVKLGIFGQTAKFGQPLCLFHSSNIDLKYKLRLKQDQIGILK